MPRWMISFDELDVFCEGLQLRAGVKASSLPKPFMIARAFVVVPGTVFNSVIKTCSFISCCILLLLQGVPPLLPNTKSSED